MPKWIPVLLVFLTLGVMANAATGWWLWQQVSSQTESLSVSEQTSQPTPFLTSSPSPSTSSVPTFSAPTSDTALTQSLETLSAKVETLEQELAALKKQPTPSKTTPTTTVVESTNNVKEITMYLGSGQTVSRDWTSLTSTTVHFQPTNYPGIKEVKFEGALRIIGGEVYAQLIDKATGAAIAESVITSNTQTSTWVTSRSLPILGSSRDYLVQLRSSSGETAYVDGARLKIYLK